jgi:TraX protein
MAPVPPISTSPMSLLSTHHLAKFIALLAMTLDHIGAYLYPDALGWRVVGRVAFPIFLFLIGHGFSHRRRHDIVLWAVLLACLSPFLGKAVFPLNALVTILCCQLLLAQVERHDWLNRCPWTVLVGCVVFWFPSILFMEYGSLGFLYALMGYAVRRGRIGSVIGHAVAVFALAGFIAGMALSFEFSMGEMLAAIAAVTLVTMLLAQYTHRPVVLAWMPNGMQHMVRFLSRYSLQYYVLHRALLQAMGVLTGALSNGFRWI